MSTEELKDCPVCGSNNLQQTLTIKDYSITQEDFTLTKCNNCTFVFTNPRPIKESIGQYYQSDEYISHTNKANNPINLIYKIVRSYNLKRKLQLVKRLTKRNKGRLLDYGCGTGAFLKTAKNNNWHVYGIEPDHSARKIAEHSTSQRIYGTIKEIDFHNKKMDAITLWHVLEHVHDLNELIITLKSILKEKGKLIIAVPNIDSLDNKIYGKHWAAYDVPRHLYHFNQTSMKTLMMKHGLTIKSIHPMPFDSYYISMLSEKYKNNTTNYINSLIKGFKSNSYAHKHNNNYSSVIYEIKK